jgi:vacuolar-type H+-ATPase subunit I/STV1
VSGDRFYHAAIRGFSLIFVVVGVALLISTIANGGSPASIGFVLGILFLAVGIGRYWIASRSLR